jgi:GNAT superfamily N-acetyltransferase
MFQVKPMSPDDFPFAVKLANTMNWNMATQDFEFMTSLEPEGCFVLFKGSERLGIATSISYGTVGWFGNLIIKEEYRNKGAGSSLVRHAVDYLLSEGVKTIGLYAYPQLMDFYSNLGFKQDMDFAVLHAENLALSTKEASPEIGKQNIQSITEFDSQCFGGNRRKLLESVILDKGNLGYFESERERVVGYVAAKVYEDMAEVGPLICQAERLDIATKLLRTVLGKLTSLNVYLCLPKKENALIHPLFEIGFKEDFSVTRMFLGRNAAKNCIYMAESLERG